MKSQHMCTQPSLNLGRLQGHDRSVELPRPGGLYFILQGNVRPLAGKVHEGIISSSDFTLTSPADAFYRLKPFLLHRQTL